MKATPTFPTRSTPNVSTAATPLILVLAVLSLLAFALWQVRQASAQVTFGAYQAPAMELTLSGALNTTLSLSDLDELSAVSFTPSAFYLLTDTAGQTFALEFSGTPDGEQSLYDLSAGTYPLTLTLLDEGEAYHQFTATQGTVDRANAAATISAFMTDEDGRSLFLNARFTQPDTASL